MNTTFSQTIDLFLNLSSAQYPAQFFRDRFGSGRTTPQFVQGDAVLLRLWLCRPAASFGQPCPLETSPGPIVFAIKLSPKATNLLAIAQDFEEVTDADSGDVHYESILHLNTAEIVAAFATGGTSLNARLDIELQSEDQSTASGRRLTYASPVQIVAEAYSGSEVDPQPATPAYPPPNEIPSLSTIGDMVRDQVTAQLPELLPVATTSALGIVKVGAGLSIAADGILALRVVPEDAAQVHPTGLVGVKDGILQSLSVNSGQFGAKQFACWDGPAGLKPAFVMHGEPMEYDLVDYWQGGTILANHPNPNVLSGSA